MNNQNNLNNQTNQEQPINFGNSLSGNNDFNQNQQIQANINNQIIPEINNSQQNNFNMVDNQPNIGINNQPIPEINNNVNIQSQNINSLPEVKIPNVEPQVNLVNQAPINQKDNNYQQLNSNTVFNNYNNSNQQIPTSVNIQNVEKKKSKKTLVIVLVIIGVLVIGYFALTFLGSFYGVSNTLDGTRKNAYLVTVKSYINGAKTLVMEYGTDYYLNCDDDKIMYMTLSEIENVSDKSPFGNKFQVGEKHNKLLDTKPSDSYIRIEVNSNTCKYQYSIYLTDGTYSVGSSDNPILESELDISDIK